MHYIALDYGRQRTGVAISDDSGSWAFAHDTWEGVSRQAIIDNTIKLARQYNTQVIILGLPRALEETTESDMEKQVLTLQSLLREAIAKTDLSVEVRTWDERFSTAQVLQQLKDAGVSQRTAKNAGGKDSIDARAAAEILRNYIG